MAEGFFLRRLATEPGRVELMPGALAAIEKARQQGGIFIGNHMGNWELGAPVLWNAGLEVAGIYRHIDSLRIDRAIRSLREPFYKAGLWRKTGQAARSVLKVAASRKVVVMLGDQRDGDGVKVDFFGRKAPSTTFPVLVARERQVPIFLARFIRKSGATFAIDAEEISFEWTNNRSQDLKAVTAIVHQRFEAWIRERPDQWMWAHRRWQSREQEERTARAAIKRNPPVVPAANAATYRQS